MYWGAKSATWMSLIPSGISAATYDMCIRLVALLHTNKITPESHVQILFCVCVVGGWVDSLV